MSTFLTQYDGKIAFVQRSHYEIKYYSAMWEVVLCSEFAEESLGFSEEVRVALAIKIEMLKAFGPALGRPHADTLNGSKYANMKELRFKADGGVWRVAFAFDVRRKAILLVAGNKRGVSEMRFYKTLTHKADKRFSAHLENHIE